jgi:hypothetical protein
MSSSSGFSGVLGKKNSFKSCGFCSESPFLELSARPSSPVCGEVSSVLRANACPFMASDGQSRVFSGSSPPATQKRAKVGCERKIRIFY